MIDKDDDDDDDDDDDMIIIAVFLGCVIFNLRSGGPSSLFLAREAQTYFRSSLLSLRSQFIFLMWLSRGGEWYFEKRGSRKILAGSRNLGRVFDKSRSLVFAWFVFTFFESRNQFHQRVSGSDF